jgi:hypothetical protein
MTDGFGGYAAALEHSRPHLHSRKKSATH